MTPASRAGSRFVFLAILPMISVGCDAKSAADPGPRARLAPPGTREAISRDPDAAPETCLGVSDKGIWSALDPHVQLALPKASPEQISATIDRTHGILVVSIDGFPRKSYPLAGAAKLTIGGHELAVRPGERTIAMATASPIRSTC